MRNLFRGILRFESPLSGDCSGCLYAGQGSHLRPCNTCLRNETFGDEFSPGALFVSKQDVDEAASV
jgi:hypothetical protein